MSAEEADRLLRYAHSAPAPVSRQEFLAALEQADPETTAGGETLWRVGGFLLARVRESSVSFNPDLGDVVRPADTWIVSGRDADLAALQR